MSYTTSLNIPKKTDEVRKMPKGLNLTRAIVGYDKDSGMVSTFPNRAMRRIALFSKDKINNRKMTKARRKNTQLVINEDGKLVKRLIHQPNKDIIERKENIEKTEQLMKGPNLWTKFIVWLSKLFKR